MSHFDRSNIEIQNKFTHPKNSYKIQKNTKKQSTQMISTKQKIITNPYFRQIMLKVSPKIANQVKINQNKQFSIHGNQHSDLQYKNFKSQVPFYDNFNNKAQKQPKIKRFVQFQQYQPDFTLKTQNFKDSGLSDCFNSRPSLRIFDVGKDIFQSAQIEQEIQI